MIARLFLLLVFLVAAAPAWATTRAAADCNVGSINTQIAASSASNAAPAVQATGKASFTGKMAIQ